MLPNESGLTNAEAKKRLAETGLNVLPEKSPPGDLVIFLSQFKNPLVYVLLVAGLTTIFLRHFSDAIIIFVAVLVNTFLGYIQERRASKALNALKKLVTPHAEVIRDGKRMKIDSSLLVPGDIVVLAQGVKVPADGSLVYTNRLYLDEAILTGESMPVSKVDGNGVFMGTIVSSGQAMMKVEKTGAESRIGGIAQTVQDIKEGTPLGKQLVWFSKKIVILVLGLAVLVFIVGILQGREWGEMLTTVIALAVSSIPEGLLVSLTVVLAIGMQKILRRRGLVRKLASAETLGGVTTICVDKTGTLTQGKMQVVDVIGEESDLAKQVVLANDLDDPLVIAAFEWGRGKVKDPIQKYQRIDSIPFSAKERFFVSLNKWSESNMVFVNGAPEILLRWVEMDTAKKKEVTAKINELTSQGRRVIGFARKEVPLSKQKLSESDAKENLTWVGMLALTDPVRPSVKEAITSAKQAGIKMIVITGDYPNTSEFVLSELGITVSKKEIMVGDELERLSVGELSEKVKTIKLFARTTPEQKLKIVDALKKNGEIVAMMGDGVNDASAIHKSDIGIVVNDASDVARESADLVLLDSNFSTIVAAIEEGRGMFENIRKIILYLLSDAFAEIVVVVGGIILGLPLPITAVQIIWINLISDGFPNLALTVDPKRAGIMQEKPRLKDEQLINRWMLSLIAIVSLLGGVIALLVFVVVYRLTGDLAQARSMAFLTLGLDSLSYVFSVRLLMVPFWKRNPLENRWLLVAVVAGFCLQVIPFASVATRNFFGIVKIDIYGWLIAIALSILVFVIIEVFKIFYKVEFVKRLLRT